MSEEKSNFGRYVTPRKFEGLRYLISGTVILGFLDGFKDDSQSIYI